MLIFRVTKYLYRRNMGQTMREFEAEGTETEDVLRDVRRIVRALSLASRDLARTHNLTVAQLLCLQVLKETARVSAGTLANALSLSPQTVTGLLDRLHARGLIARERSETDRRQVLISLSEEGAKLLATTSPSLQDRFVQRFSTLPPARRSALAKALSEIVNLLEADSLDAAPVLAPGHTLTTPGHTVEPVIAPALTVDDNAASTPVAD